MTRQWLALLALLTGLAAVGAPVSAQEAETLSCEIGALTESAAETATSHAALHVLSKRSAQLAAVTPTYCLLVAAMPAHSSVLIGIDRAHI
jgi:hypothetical protein